MPAPAPWRSCTRSFLPDRSCDLSRWTPRDPSVLNSILKGSDCVVGCVPPHINPNLAELCLSLGIHYCDLGGNDAIVQQQLALNERAQEKSVWIVPNCGLAPGLTNILCLHGIEQFDEVEAAHLRVGDVPL